MKTFKEFADSLTNDDIDLEDKLNNMYESEKTSQRQKERLG